MGYGAADAEDVLQDVSLKAMKEDQPWQSEANCYRWLVRVTVNRCLSQRRSRSRFSRHTARIWEKQVSTEVDRDSGGRRGGQGRRIGVRATVHGRTGAKVTDAVDTAILLRHEIRSDRRNPGDTRVDHPGPPASGATDPGEVLGQKGNQAMKNNPCATIEGKLVDYADGELPEGEVATIEAHLAGCPECRRLMFHLNRSLDACRVIWQDKLAEAVSCSEEEVGKRPARVGWYGGLAAGVLVLIAVGFAGYAQKSARAVDLDQVLRQIAEAGRAARLLAVADLLRERCGYDDLVERKYEYIVETFSTSDFAEEARSRLRKETNNEASGSFSSVFGSRGS